MARGTSGTSCPSTLPVRPPARARPARSATRRSRTCSGGADAKQAILKDIIAVEISKDVDLDAGSDSDGDDDDEGPHNAIAAAANAARSKTGSALQQKIFGKTIVFTETKAECNELVSGGVFKTLTAQAIHGDIG